MNDLGNDRCVGDKERICNGCHDPKPVSVELRTFRMETGDYETLCPDCIRQSHDLIDHEVPARNDLSDTDNEQ